MNAGFESRRTVIDGRELVARGIGALALSLVGNWLVLWLVLAFDLVEPFEPISFSPVTLLTALGVLGAIVVYGALTRRSATPDRTFVVIAAVVLVLSFVPDLALLSSDPAATVPAVIVLMVMHVVAAVACVVMLTDRFTPLSS